MSFELNLKLPGAEALAVAEKELRETEENVKDGLAKLRAYLEEDKTLYFKTDDELLLIFLRPCKFYAKSAYELMRRVAEFKEKNSSLLKNLLPSDEKESITKHDIVNVIKERDHKGRRILITNCGKKWNTSVVNSDQLFRLFYLIHEFAILEPETQIYGTVVILDFEGMSMKQVMEITPTFCMRLVNFIQDAMPLRLKEIHIVKQSILFNMIWQMIKPFIREKLKSRIFFHGNKMSSFHNHIPPAYLPENYGGELPKIDYSSAEWYPVMLKHEDRIKQWNTYGFRRDEQ